MQGALSYMLYFSGFRNDRLLSYYFQVQTLSSEKALWTKTRASEAMFRSSIEMEFERPTGKMRGGSSRME